MHREWSDVMATVDWARVAVPQPDRYDTDTVLRLAVTRSPNVPSRPSVGQHSGRWFVVSPIYASRPDFRRDFSEFVTAPSDHPNIASGVALLDTWAVGADQARRMITVLHAGLSPEVDFDVGWLKLVSWCHSYDDAFGTLWATVHSAVGLAEAIVHEMAHHKLRACGIFFERAESLIMNHQGDRAPSPLLNGLARPLPAVLHAHYAVLHMAALELAILAADMEPAVPLVRHLLRTNLKLLEECGGVLEDRLRLDARGAAFFGTLRNWQRQLVSDGERFL